MYTRSYYPDASEVPENYSGIAVRRDEPAPEAETNAPISEDTESVGLLSDGINSNFGDNTAIPTLLSRLGGLTHKLGIKKFGTEELLIIGVSLYLLFSKSGDKECAIILLLLLLVN